MDAPVRVAFCKVLFWKNGGQFTPTGLPIFKHRIRGRCSRAFDCGACSYLQEWIAYLASQGWSWGWECDKCLKETKKTDEANGLVRSVQGFYQAGRRSDRTPDDPDYDPDRPGLEGCTTCGWETSFLQLVVRRPKT